MEAKLFEFADRDFKEVYTVIDKENKRLHISSVNYNYNITLTLTADLDWQLNELTKYEEAHLAAKVKYVVNEIITELGY